MLMRERRMNYQHHSPPSSGGCLTLSALPYQCSLQKMFFTLPSSTQLCSFIVHPPLAAGHSPLHNSKYGRRKQSSAAQETGLHVYADMMNIFVNMLS